MNVDYSKPWKEVFALVAQIKAEDKRKRNQDHLVEELDRRDEEKLQAKEKREKADEREQALEQMLATSERIADFSGQLDNLDTASVKALMENGAALDDVHLQLKAMLDQADKLPDGRRIFKTYDGLRVFDEHGTEVPAAIVDPHSIDDRFSHWEMFKAVKDKESNLLTERHEILTYQARLDDARTRVDKGGITNGELDALDADLKASMPQGLRAEAEHQAGKADDPKLKAKDVASASLPLDEALRATAPRPSPM